ncbi:GNAT family N-acetyltransferase [Cytobacillus purgationiresistens]|uniref:Ribosomal-protein-serine acetyltransferase n=1 Tax=Cytobacillus purgationiresistens TaxID=863449 RepID=A0ABU0AAB9_9BACI|nr:GNAT family protein [Cytobacillus purgationiresistens]MDQ0268193.1 ribosomal-protein-serine acetyltransferase [Cytobacillus purgationiresistens]
MFSFKVDEELSIELFQQHHKEELFSFIDENRIHLRKWLSWVDKREKADDLDPVIRVWLQKYADNNGFDAGVRVNGQLVGMIGLHQIDWKNRTTSVGYLLGEEAQGKGVITRALSSLNDYLFDQMDLNRVEIQCAASNHKSMAVPERLGFMKEGMVRQGQWLYDHFEDIVTYSILKEEWLNRK